jgi:hypothetical protein
MSRLAELARPKASNRVLLAAAPTGFEGPNASNNLLLAEGRCELCGGSLPEEHRHVADIQAQSLLCSCRACVVLLGRDGAGGGHFKLVPERRLLLDEFVLGDEQWAALQLPVDLAFFFQSTPAGRVVALYPSPAGATESQLRLEAWAELERANPVLRELEPDVEALLVNRMGGAREQFLVPIDDCYQLVALIRTHWKGLAGGPDVQRELAAFFDRLREVT